LSLHHQHIYVDSVCNDISNLEIKAKNTISPLQEHKFQHDDNIKLLKLLKVKIFEHDNCIGFEM